MIHFVVNPHDPTFDYALICKDLFGDNKCLVMLEKKNRDHVHVQGELKEAMTNEQWRGYIARLNMSHYKRHQDPKARPCKKRKIPADEVGFQYMAKELDTSLVLYKQGITDEDLEDLFESSNELREEIKSKLGEYLVQAVVRRSGESARELHKRLCGASLKYYLDQEKMCPPNIKLLVRHFMLKYYGNSADVFDYLSELIM